MRLSCQVISSVLQCGHLLIAVKTKQIKGELRARAKANEVGGKPAVENGGLSTADNDKQSKKKK